MKRAFIASLLIAALATAANCLAAGQCCPDGNCPDCKPGLFQRCTSWMHMKHCDGCGKTCGPFHKCGGLFHGCRKGGPGVVDYGGPPSAQITYPYYTNRGPRDFLDPNPRGIGP